MTTIVLPISSARAGIQRNLVSPASDIIHEDGQCGVGLKIGCHGACSGQAKMTARNLGIERVAVPDVTADSAPLAIDVDLNPTRRRVGTAG